MGFFVTYAVCIFKSIRFYMCERILLRLLCCIWLRSQRFIVCVCEMRLNDRWCGFMSFFSISPLFCQSDSSFPWRTDLLFNHHCQHTRARARAHFLRNSCIRWLFFSFFFLWTCWIKSHSAWLLLHRNPLCDIMYSVNICALSVTGSTQISQRNKILFYINSTA